MKTIGVLGGLGPEATVDYYKEIIKDFNNLNEDGSLAYPEIVIYSVTMSEFIGLLEKGENEKAADYLIDCLHKIEKAGANFAAISANTPHLLFDYIQSKVNLPLISIVDACVLAAKKLNVRKCALIGTKFTMQNNFYQKTFLRHNIEIVVPDGRQIEIINTKLFKELEPGIFKEETKQEILDILSLIKEHENIEAVILGCTEFPLMFTECNYLGLPFLNTTKIHVDTIINECIKI